MRSTLFLLVLVLPSFAHAQEKIDQEWLDKVAALEPKEQAKTIHAKLQDLNFRRPEQVSFTADGNKIVEFGFLGNGVKDITPLAALKHVTKLNFAGTPPVSEDGKERVEDLAAIEKMPLVELNMALVQGEEPRSAQGHEAEEVRLQLQPGANAAAAAGHAARNVDVPGQRHRVAQRRAEGAAGVGRMQLDEGFRSEPAAGTPLKTLLANYTEIADLTPLQGMPLETLDLHKTNLSELGPLKGVPLKTLILQYTNVTDLKALNGSPLTYLDLQFTPVKDIGPLKGVPLTTLYLKSTKVQDLSALKGSPLTLLVLENTPVKDLSPLAGVPLQTLYINSTPVANLTPLKDSGLTTLGAQHVRQGPVAAQGCAARLSRHSQLEGRRSVAAQGIDQAAAIVFAGCPVSSLAPLADVPVAALDLTGTKVASLLPLKSMKVVQLTLSKTAIKSVAPEGHQGRLAGTTGHGHRRSDAAQGPALPLLGHQEHVRA